MNRKQVMRDLIERAQRGDRPAFDKLLAGNSGRLRAIALHVLGRGGQGIDIEDVLQETSLRAFQRIRAFAWQGEDSFLRWLGGIAGNVIREIEKKRRRSPLIAIERDIEGRGIVASRALRREERFSRLQKAFEALSEDHREVIRLARFEGLPLREVARRMQRSPGAVRQLLWRALQALKASFGDTESFHLPERDIEDGDPQDDRGAP